MHRDAPIEQQCLVYSLHIVQSEAGKAECAGLLREALGDAVEVSQLRE